MPLKRGIVLVMVAGFLVLLLLLSIGLVQMTKSSTAQGVAALARARAALAAGAGLEYAAARLDASSLPAVPRTADNRGDDWAFRDPAATHPRRSVHPSYAHGESWTDTPSAAGNGLDDDGDGMTDEEGEGAGIRTDDEPFTDRDGDGRFSTWTGRLRGGAEGRRGGRFSLRIDAGAADGAVPVNAGYLDDRGRMDPAVPDHQEFGPGPLVHPYHRALEHVLGNLGAVCGLTTRCERVRAGGSADPDDWFWISWLGYDLLANRPAGGYKSRGGIRRAMLSLGYTGAECDAVSPYLDPGSSSVAGEGGRSRGPDGADFPPYAPVNLTVAPKPVLTALWMQLAAAPPSDPACALSFPGAAWWGTPFSRAGRPDWIYSYVLLQIHRDDASRLADATMVLRESEPLSWQGILKRWCEQAGALFPREAADLGNPEERSWLQAKVDLAFQAVCADPFPYPDAGRPGAFPADARVGGLTTWACWGVDRTPQTPASVLPLQAVSFSRIRRSRRPANYPASFPAPADPWGEGPDDPFLPYDATVADAESEESFLLAQGGILTPPCRFDVVSCGKSGDADAVEEGMLRLGGILRFASQEDFENISGGACLARRGIRVEDEPDPTARRGVEADLFTNLSDGSQEKRLYPHVVSLPRWNPRAFPGGTASRCYGALALAPRQTGLQGADLYWPVREDADGVLNNPAPPANSDFWHEQGVSATPPAIPFPADPAAAPDGERITPYFMASTDLLPLDCPGMQGAIGNVVQGFSIEAWVRPRDRWSGSSETLLLGGFPWPIQSLRLDAVRGWIGAMRGTSYRVGIDWGAVSGSKEWFAPDAEVLGRITWTHHVVLTAQWDEALQMTVLRLFVDGCDDPQSSNPMTIFLAGGILNIGNEGLRVEGVDDLRLYGSVLDPTVLPSGGPPAWCAPTRTRALFEQGRFVRHGLFRSPLYVLEEAQTLRSAQWTGVIPPGFPTDCVQTRLRGFLDEAGQVEAPWSPRTLGPPGAAENLPRPCPARSFRYEVEFDCTAVPEKNMTDTPVFESIELSLGKRPVWER